MPQHALGCVATNLPWCRHCHLPWRLQLQSDPRILRDFPAIENIPTSDLTPLGVIGEGMHMDFMLPLTCTIFHTNILRL